MKPGGVDAVERRVAQEKAGDGDAAEQQAAHEKPSDGDAAERRAAHEERYRRERAERPPAEIRDVFDRQWRNIESRVQNLVQHLVKLKTEYANAFGLAADLGDGRTRLSVYATGADFFEDVARAHGEVFAEMARLVPFLGGMLRDTEQGFHEMNRALKARVEVYRGSEGCATCYAAALTALSGSFVDTLAPLDRGAYHAFSTGPGDLANPLSQNPLTGENYAHPLLDDAAETKPGGGLDNRFTAKVTTRPSASAGDPPLTSNLGWTRYPSPTSPIPIIRNEELILLRAEANNALGNAVPSAADINFIRARSGGLAVNAGLAALTPAQRLDEILRPRRYSLLYEGGHRWIDARRTGTVASLTIDRPGTDRNPPHLTYPIPADECNGRVGTPVECP